MPELRGVPSDEEYKAFKTQIQSLEEDLEGLRGTHGAIILVAVTSVLSFVVSILASLVAMSIDDISKIISDIY